MSHKTNIINLHEYADLIDKYNTHFLEYILKTRYSIISLSVEQLIHRDPANVNILLFISLVNSQNIPQSFLQKYKNGEDIKPFVNDLKEYSLLKQDCSSGSTITVYRSTQAIILSYILKKYGLDGTKARVESIGRTLEQVVGNVLEKLNTSHIKRTLKHVQAFLSQDQLISATTKNFLTFTIGRMYGYLGQYGKARDFLEQILGVDSQDYGVDIKRAQIYTHLGSIYKELANPQKSQDFLEQSLTIYNKNPAENQGNIARSLAYLGDTYKNKGDLLKAKSILEQSILLYRQAHSPFDYSGLILALTIFGSTQRELRNIDSAIDALEESLSLSRAHTPGNIMGLSRTLNYLGPAYASRGNFEKARVALEQSIEYVKKHTPKNNILVGRSLVHLGNVYRELGHYKQAREILEEAFAIHQIHHPQDHSQYAWSLLHLGFVNRELGQPQAAKLILEQCLNTYKKHFDEDNIRVAWIDAQLAKVHNDLHNYDIAQQLLEKSIPIYEKTYGMRNVETARVVRTLGQTYLLKGDLKTAKIHFENILNIFQENKHPDVYKVGEDLADLFLIVESKDKTIGYLTQSLEVVKTAFPENSPHRIRIQDKLQSLDA